MKFTGTQTEKDERLRANSIVRLRDESSIALAPYAADDEAKKKPRMFALLAYTGAEVDRWYGRFAIDLAGIEGDPVIAVLLEHDDDCPVGVATKRETTPRGLEISGHLLSNEDAVALATNADEGLPYKCSVGLRVLVSEEVAAGVEIQLNGRVMHGPLTIARRSRLIEASFITCDPADPNTAAAVMHREGIMADLASAPAATEQFKAEAAKAARAELKARAEELRTAFPDRQQFATECALEGLTLVEAKAKLSDVVLAELKAAKDSDAKAEAARTKGATEIAALRAMAGIGSGERRVHEAVVVPAEALAQDASLDRAREEFSRNPIARSVFTATWAGRDPVARYAAALRFEQRLANPGRDGFGSPDRNRLALKTMSERLMESGGARERLSSWGLSGPDYADMTVKGYLGALYNPLEDALGGSWAPRIGVPVDSTQETETHRWFGFPPQFREWVGDRQVAPLNRYVIQATNRTYEATLLIAIVDFLFEKSGQLAIRLGEMGRRVAGHWEKLVSDLINANTAAGAYDGQAFFSATHTLGGSAGTVTNDLTAAEVPALNVATAAAPTVQEAADALMAVTAYLYTYLDDKGEPFNGDARQFVVMVPPNLWPAFHAATKVQRLTAGGDNPVQVQDPRWSVVPNPRLTSTTKFYVFREDSRFKPFILQEATAIEMEFQAAGSDLAFSRDAYAFGLKTRRTAQYGEWAHALRATLS